MRQSGGTMATMRCIAIGSLAVAGLTSAQTAKIWTKYVEAYQNKSPLPLPDWSYAGYQHSEKPIPEVKDRVFDVTKYGAKGDGKTYCDRQVQSAIDAASKAGGGIVYFPKGTYLFGARKDSPLGGDSVLRVKTGNIVLRGEGASDDGSVLKLVQPQTDIPFLEIMPLSPGGASKLAIMTATAPRNAMSIRVDNVAALEKEKCFRIRYGDTNTYPAKGTKYTKYVYKDAYLPEAWKDITTKGPVFFEYHCIDRIDRKTNTVYLTEPTQIDFIKHETPFEIWKYKAIEEVGVEDLLFKGSWDTIKAPFCHHCSPLDDWGWTALWVLYTRNFWIRNCEFRDWNQGVRLYQTSHGTIRECLFSGKKGHHSMESRQSYGTLIMDCVDTAGTHHGPSVSFYDEGVVYLRHQMKVGQNIDSHASNPVNSLFDDVTGGTFQNSGGNLVDYPNHSGNATFWNFNHRGFNEQKTFKYNFWPTPPRDGKKGGMSWYKPNFIGLHGDPITIEQETAGYIESWGQPVEPKSLFTAQLCLRLGSSKCPEGIPAALGPRDRSSVEGQSGATDAESSGVNIGAIIGGVIGGCACVALIAGTIYAKKSGAFDRASARLETIRKIQGGNGESSDTLKNAGSKNSLFRSSSLLGSPSNPMANTSGFISGVCV